MCPISCGNWNNATKSGPWALNLNNNRTNSNNNVGFRSDCAFNLRSQKGKSGAQGLAVQAYRPKCACTALLSRAAENQGGAQ
jgi:hypothetical protein